jgi:ATP-binding cassette subfamily B protein RaxB
MQFNIFNNKKIKEIYQSEIADCGIACVAMILNYYGKSYSLEDLKIKYSSSVEGSSLNDIIKITKNENIIALPYEIEEEDIQDIKTPCIAHWNKNHFVVISKITDTQVTIYDPANGKLTYSMSDFIDDFSFIVCEMSPDENFSSNKVKNKNNNSLINVITNITNSWRDIFNILLMSISLEIFVIILPLFSKVIIDNIVIENNKDLLIPIGIGFIFIVFFKSLSEWFRNNMLLYLTANIQISLKYNILNKLLKLPLSFYKKRGVADILSKFESLEEIKKTISKGVIESSIDAFTIIITASVMIYLNLIMFFIVFLFLLVVLLIKFLYLQKIKFKTNKLINSQIEEDNFLIEALKTIETTRGHNQEDFVFKKWYGLYIQYIKNNTSLNKLNITIDSIEDFFINSQRVVILWIGTAFIINNEITIGALFAFVAYQIIFTNQLSNLITNLFKFRIINIHFEKINDIKNAKEEKSRIGSISNDIFNQKIKGRIELKNIYFKYEGASHYLFENFNLTIEHGEHIIINGHSGSGKSTLIKIIAGLLPIEKGEVLVDGMNIKDVGLEKYREQIGLVLQNEEQIYSGSVFDNINLFQEVIEYERLYKATRKAEIHDEIENMKMGYQTILGEIGNNFSGGQVQRLLLSRAFYKQPLILLLDESTNALDKNLEMKIFNNLKKDNMTKISISHREENQSLVDRVINLDELKNEK